MVTGAPVSRTVDRASERWIPSQGGSTPVKLTCRTELPVRRTFERQGSLVARPGWRTVMPKTCSQCQTENPDQANHCLNCGALLAGGTTAGPGAGQPASAGAGPAAASGGSSVPAYHFDAARLTTADIICA